MIGEALAEQQDALIVEIRVDKIQLRNLAADTFPASAKHMKRDASVRCQIGA